MTHSYNVSACILCTNSDNFNETSSGLFETDNNVADINNLVNPSARLTTASDAYDHLAEASTCLTSTITKVNVNISNIININKYSSLSKLLRITCWVMKAKTKFLRKINKNKKESVTEEMINSVDLSMTKKLWLREVQNDLRRVENFKNVSYQLDLFEDEDGLWRCGGRLAKSNLPYSVVYPYIIPTEHYFATLIVLKSHDNVKHNGVRDTINNLREEFWISKSRNFVKGIINKCLLCQKFEGPCYDYPKLGPLPDSRVNFDFPYLSIGIDYAGSVYVRNIYNTKDNDLYKAWIVLITCCSSRCTYLDTVPDCYRHSYVNILKRFISIHGAPKLIISDNGPTFSDEVKTFASSRGITWKSNIQKAPWMGGIFE